jgi:cold shock CspA family protein
MMRGSITGFLRKQGGGFILGEDGCEVYFDRSGINASEIAGLSVGQWVEYELQYGFERLRATNVKILRGEQGQASSLPSIPHKETSS